MIMLEIPIAKALLHFIWEGTLISAILALFLTVLRRSSAQSRYLAACAAMVAMLIGFVSTVVLMMPSTAPTAAIPVAPIGFVPSFSISGPAPASLHPAWGWLVAVWMAGVGVCYLRTAGGWLRS